MKKLILATLILVLSLAVGAKAGFVFGTPRLGDYTVYPSLSPDELTMFCVKIVGGYGKDDLWVKTRPTKHDPWPISPTSAVNLGAQVNSPDDDRAPDISPDGLTLYFHSDRAGGSGGRDLWVTTRPSTDDPWTQAVNLGPPVNSSVDDADPSMTADGLSLFFVSWRAGGLGFDDLWVTTRPTKSDPWGDPVNLGSTVNSSSSDYLPDISADGLSLFFTSNRPGGHGGGYGDIWVTKRKTVDDPWGEPENLGPMVNGSTNEIGPEISADGATLYFFSNDRQTPAGPTWSIWEASMTLVVDLNGDNTLDFRDFSELSQFWCRENSLADIAPVPAGDGFVDGLDFAVLARYWLWVPTEEAWGPTPANGAQEVPANTTLRWYLGDLLDIEGYTVSYIVYFGTDAAALVELDTVERNNYDVDGLDPSTTYYWRIDTKRRKNSPPFPSIITTGNIWSFTTSGG